MRGSVSSISVCILALVLLASVATPASAQTTQFTWVDVTLTPERFDADLYGEQITGDDALALRTEIDEDHGNADGEVSADERDAWIEASVQELNDQLSNPFVQGLTKKITVNGRAPLESLVTGMDLSENVIGPADDDSTVVRDVQAALRYTNTTLDRANVSFAQDFRQALIGMEWDYAVFHGDDTWQIDAATIVPDGPDNRFWTGSDFNTTYAEMDEFSSGFEPLTFQLDGTTKTPGSNGGDKKDSPGLALPSLLVLLVGLAAVLHRRD